jgi:hypothetical protein
MHQNPRKPRDSDTGPPRHPQEQSRPSILIQPHGEPALHGHACTLHHAPGTVRPHPSYNRAAALATPEGTRTTAPGHVRPRTAAATWTRPSATPSYDDQPSDEPELHGHEGALLPALGPSGRRSQRARARGGHRNRHGHGRPLRTSRARATSSLQTCPDYTRQDRFPRHSQRTQTNDHKRLGRLALRGQATRSQGTPHQHRAVPR